MPVASAEYLRQRATWGVLAILVLPFLAIGIFLIFLSGMSHGLEIANWFDPLFFQYNVLIWMLFVLLIPTITYLYVQNMRDEREKRLQYELQEATWEERKEYIQAVIQRQFGLSNYVGCTLTLMFVVAIGLAVLLLLKPLPDHGTGLDYSKGANMFLMGAYIVWSPTVNSIAYFDRVVTSLTAFQFGFLGGYVYFIQHLVRSYFTMDLTPNTFVAMSIRMVTAGVVSLVVSFCLPMLQGAVAPATGDNLRALLPVVSFGIGYFPEWGLLVIAKMTRRVLLLAHNQKLISTPLSKLAGMSYEHEVRLRRQGYDSIENIAEANLVEMAVRTGFSYSQLRTWVGEAWLHLRFGSEAYLQLVDASGIRTADQFKKVFCDDREPGTERLDAEALLDVLPKLRVKIICVAHMVREWNPDGRSVADKKG